MKHEKNSRQRGFTLVEVLIALLVLSIGLLGVAAMQIKALQGAHVAYQRSIASLAAQDAQERLWAQLAVNLTTCPTGAGVDTLQSDWQGAWGAYLPSFSASSTLIGNLECEYVVDVVWNDVRSERASESFSYAFRLPSEVSP